MSITRAFTTRRVKQSVQLAEEKAVQRSNTTTKGAASALRHKISGPVELIHTTNMLSYNAPDIQPMSAISTGSSQRSDDDMSDSAVTNGTTPPTSPDVESPAKMSAGPQPNHLSSFFTTGPVQHKTPTSATSAAGPVIPQRTVSHSKKQYNLVRQRSASGLSQQSHQSQQSHRTLSTKASLTFSRSSSTSTSTSVSSVPVHHQHQQHKSKLSNTVTSSPPSAPTSPPRQRSIRQQPPPVQHSKSTSSASIQQRQQQQQQQHPFGNELAQVSELAEEYGVKDQMAANVVDLQDHEMQQRGLFKISADEYLSEVRSLFATFMVPPRPVAAAWI